MRLALLLFGLCVAHLGVTLFLLSNLGSDPFNVLISGIFRAVSWPEPLLMTHGRVHLAVSLLIVAVLLFSARSYVRLGTLLCMALGGPIIDAFSLLLSPVITASLPLWARLAVMAVGCVILAFGMTIVICSGAGTGPNDLVAVVISDKLKAPFGIVRVITDVIFALTGLLLGGTLGVGTVVCAFLVGPVAQLLMPVSGRLCDRAVEKVKKTKKEAKK